MVAGFDVWIWGSSESVGSFEWTGVQDRSIAKAPATTTSVEEVTERPCGDKAGSIIMAADLAKDDNVSFLLDLSSEASDSTGFLRKKSSVEETS